MSTSPPAAEIVQPPLVLPPVNIVSTGDGISKALLLSVRSARGLSDRFAGKDVSEKSISPDDAKHSSHAVKWESIVSILESNEVLGLSSQQASARLKAFGQNKLAEPKPDSVLYRIFKQINSVLIYLLLIAACVAGGFQEWAEFGLILGVVVINVSIGFIQEGKALAATQALKAMLSLKAIVIRDGKRCEIHAEDVVPGDVVFVESGNKSPADIRLIQVNNLSVSESMLTGESKNVNKMIGVLPEKIALGDRKNMLFSATMIAKGNGLGIVVGTGDMTEIGKINKSVNEVKEEKTHLMKQIDAFGLWIACVCVPVAIASFCLAYFTGKSAYNVSKAFVEMVAIVVAIIPESLPALVSITLSLATANMARNNAIIKSLPSVETLGSVSVICSDKTGTLTKNEMTCIAVQTASAKFAVSAVGFDSTGGKITNETTELVVTLQEDVVLGELVLAGCLCNDSRVNKVIVKERMQCLPVGDPTEVALVTLGEKVGLQAEELRKANPRVGVIPFESEYKFMATFHAKEGDIVVGYFKGAPDRLIPRCKEQIDNLGNAAPANHEFWMAQASAFAQQGLRTIGICRMSIPLSQLGGVLNQGAKIVTQAPEPFLQILGIAAIMDPPREECKAAIREAHSAFITVKMITGDHVDTAKAIGTQLGLVDETHPNALTGAQLDAMTPEELRFAMKECNIFARASPENKISIVRALQANGNICSMTGDGVNDAPALRAADIGVAMGITGSDVSKDAARMILVDDNFTTIVVAVREGRVVFDNLRKLFIFNIPINMAQGAIVFFALCLQMPEIPLTAIQILWVNLASSVILGFALALEPAEEDIMLRPPRPITKGLIGKLFYWRTIFVGLLMVVFVLSAVTWIFRLDPARYTANEQHALALNTLVFCEISYLYSCRFLKLSSFNRRVLFGNPYAHFSAILMIVLQVMITYIPGLNGFFSMTGMDGVQWGIALFFAFLTFVVVEVEKALTDPLRPYWLPVVRWFEKYLCSWSFPACPKCTCLCTDCVTHDEAKIVKPKAQRRSVFKLFQGGSVRFEPEKLQEQV